MPLVQNDWAMLACALAAAAAEGLLVWLALRKAGVAALPRTLAALLPGLYLFIFAKAGYELLQFGEPVSLFRWCFTAGLLGLIAGSWHAARLCRIPAMPLLDRTAPGLCLAMALLRLGQRWLGEVGFGPLLEEGSLLCRPPFVMMNDWDEPMLAIWLLEMLAALIALGLTVLSVRKQKGAPGVSLCRAVFLLTIPQLLLEQFRSGHFMRFRMMRLEQAVLALAALAALCCLCAAIARRKPGRRWAAFWPAAVFVLLAAVIAVIQFVLDGKLFELPDAASWTIYVLAVLGMLGLCGGCAHAYAMNVTIKGE